MGHAAVGPGVYRVLSVCSSEHGAAVEVRSGADLSQRDAPPAPPRARRKR